MEIKKKYNKKIFKIIKKNIKCPNCKKISVDKYAPFCSNKCSDLDLIKWFSNNNSINLE